MNIRVIDIMNKIDDIETSLGVDAISYGAYSLDRHSYVRDLYPETRHEVLFFNNPYSYAYKDILISDDDILSYLLSHKGILFFPALQKGCRHGFKVEFDMKELSLRPITDDINQDIDGQLVFGLK